MNAERDLSRANCPYRGLEPFDERDAAFFFGRERETRLIAASLFAAPLTLLYGASGVGKSSVLRAGVLPRLRERRDLLPVVFPTLLNAPDNGSAAPVIRGWQTDPLGGIKETAALALYASAGDDRNLRARFQDVVLQHEMGSLRGFLSACHQVSGRRLMVILDQFEEYSLYHPTDEAFAEEFPKAVVPGDLSVSFLVSLREDSLAKLDRFKGRIPTLWDSYRRVDHLDRRAAEDAIRLPLREYNRRRPEAASMEIERQLVEAVLRDVQAENVHFEETGGGTIGGISGTEGRIETPYLQLVLMRLWERELEEGSSVLRLTTLQNEGGAAEIVRTHLDRVMDQFSVEERDVAARVFHRLVTPSGAKIAFSVSDLAEYEAIEAAQLAPILQRLEEGSRRILRRVAMRSDVSDEPRYEIFHDRLGKAILAWRSKRLKEHEREKRQRDDTTQTRLIVQTRASERQRIDAVIQTLGSEGQAVWGRIMLYLISTDGRRFAQTAGDLASLSQQPLDLVHQVLRACVQGGLVRMAYGSVPQRFEVVNDAVAGSLLEWHSEYVRDRTQLISTAPPSPSPPPADAFPYGLVRDILRKGRVIPFLGAGISLSGREENLRSLGPDSSFILSGREMKEALAKECSFPASEFEASDVSEVASFYVQRFGRDRLDEWLHARLGQPHLQPSAAHRVIARAAGHAPMTILTTNYDALMEKALDESGAEYHTIAYLPQNRFGSEDVVLLRHGSAEVLYLKASTDTEDLADKTLVVRLHGPAMRERLGRFGSYVVTEEDQIDWLARLRTHSTALPRFLSARLEKGHLLSLGHSARDWSQRALLRMLFEKNFERRTSWAVALNPAPLSVMTWQRYGVEVYNVELNEWASRMFG